MTRVSWGPTVGARFDQYADRTVDAALSQGARPNGAVEERA
jgi:hypothetical protein